MFRKELEPDAGMVFSFSYPQQLRFWGRNTFIPLDIAFINSDGMIEKISNISPFNDRDVVVSKTKCQIAIEANVDYFDDHDIYVGDYVEFDPISDNKSRVIFRKAKDFELINGKTKIAQRTPFVSPEEMEEFVPVNEEGKALPVYRAEDLVGTLVDEEEVEETPPIDQPSPEVQENLPEGMPLEPQPDVPSPDKEYPEFEHPAVALAWAEEHGESVRIYYVTQSGKDIEREIEPHGQFAAKTTGNQILVTYDETVGDIRSFIVSNIYHYEFSGEQFEPKFRVE